MFEVYLRCWHVCILIHTLVTFKCELKEKRCIGLWFQRCQSGIWVHGGSQSWLCECVAKSACLMACGGGGEKSASEKGHDCLCDLPSRASFLSFLPAPTQPTHILPMLSQHPRPGALCGLKPISSYCISTDPITDEWTQEHNHSVPRTES